MNRRSIRAASAHLTTVTALTVGLATPLMAAPANAAPADSLSAAASRSTAPASATSSYAGFGMRVLTVAASKRGAPYRYGAAGPRAFDCSGYTSWVYRKLGRSLPRTAHAQYAALRHVSRAGARPGDLIFFGGRYKNHVGIYAGGNRMWHAPSSGRTVTLAKIYSSRVTFGRL